MSYVTTNIRLDQTLHKKLRLMAIERNMSFAKLIREAIDHFLQDPPPPPNDRSLKNDPFWKVIGIGSSEIRDGSIHHDHYLYGWPKEQKADEEK